MKKQIENIATLLPDFIKNAFDYVKNNFTENGQELFENANGSAALVIKILAQPLIDKYFENKTDKKLENFGLATYIKASLVQANDSINIIKENINDDFSPKIVFDIINNAIQEDIDSFDPTQIILIFQPLYHPAIILIKNNYKRILQDLEVDSASIENFIKHFNENIEETIVKEFGNDYDEHLKKIESYRIKDNEAHILFDTIQNGKIGFKDSENLKYETTYASWKNVRNFRNSTDLLIDDEEYEKYESKLRPIEDLISEYFNRNPQNNLDDILFIVADFGKGKSVFMKHYASEIAKQYLGKSEGYFPIYFNLRNYSKYSSVDSKLGVIADFLETNYSIKIDDDYFKKKKYIFLIDSLDESGELNKRSIDKVINSVKSIQGINKSLYKTNRIIITSRPFDEGFSNHLLDHNPFNIKNNEKRDVPQYLNIHGFKKTQFNNWLFETLENYKDILNLNTTGIAELIVNAIKRGDRADIYEELLKNETLSRSELRRPIFAYMIYQLIINKVDFIEVGKLGVYLSFLNLLTKEAKHIHDSQYQVNLSEELEFRNILHATSTLWVYQKQRGKQGMLKKADICRVLDGKIISEIDNEVIEKFKGQGFTEIQFLSHSYFGENNNILHFQHQSFAEILLAEYYLKVFIKYSLDEDADIEEARAKLVIGEPTEQTILFLKELLDLLRETSIMSKDIVVIEKRKLLFPLMASLSIRKHNKLFSNHLHFSWFNKYNLGENQVEYPKEALEEWCITTKEIEKIINYASLILNSKTFYLPIQGNAKTALYNSEVFEVTNYSKNNIMQGFDKWISLIVGNHLFNSFEDRENPLLFNHKYKINFYQLFDMIRSWNYAYQEPCPFWGTELFQGIDMSENDNQLNLSHGDFDGINFSYSIFKNIRSWGANWSRANLDYCSFYDTQLITCWFLGTKIREIRDLKNLQMMNCQATTSGFILLDGLRTENLETKMSYDDLSKNRYNPYIEYFDIQEDPAFDTCRGFMIYGLKNSFFTILALKKMFKFDNDHSKKVFFQQIDTLKKYEVKKRNKKLSNEIKTS
ncbi:NACHT domain-containing protein [Flavobacterium artemisiae]|uniref:NACHT domain-containing protein n=1 Tax=Flavobacterium artemisiae TaxID=2126556 RepID=A0ABW4HC14_9FLAO